MSTAHTRRYSYSKLDLEVAFLALYRLEYRDVSLAGAAVIDIDLSHSW